MNHVATFVLPLAASRVLDVLHATLEVGELSIMSHAQIASLGHLSEGTVSRAMPVLVEHGFLERTWDDELNGGRGGYLLTLLPLPDEEESSHPGAIGSATDPTPSPVEAVEKDQELIPAAPNMVLDHDLSQEEESARARVPIFSEQDPLYRYLSGIPNMHPRAAERALLSRLGSLADFQRDEALAASRPGIKLPAYFVIAEWRAGRRVQPQIVQEQEPSYGREGREDTHRGHRERVAPSLPRAGSSRATPFVGAPIYDSIDW